MIKYQIELKRQSGRPFYATKELAASTLSPFDHFPYKYFWRGTYKESNPIVIEREAGYRPRRDKCYKRLGTPQSCTHASCWNFPCSTVYPPKQAKRKQIEFGQELCENNSNITLAP